MGVFDELALLVPDTFGGQRAATEGKPLEELIESFALVGCRLDQPPQLDIGEKVLVTANGPLRTFTLLHDARPVLLNFGEPGAFHMTSWSDRVRLLDARYGGTWELPAIGAVNAPAAVLVRPDGYVAWVGDQTQAGLAEALTTCFGPPTAD